MTKEPPTTKESLLDQHLRLMEGVSYEAKDHEEFSRAMALKPAPLSLTEKSKNGLKPIYLGLAATFFLGLLPFLLPEFLSDQTPPFSPKGQYGVSVYWKRDGQVHRLKSHDRSLQAGDEITVEVHSGVNSIVFLGIYNRQGQRLHDGQSFLSSQSFVSRGESQILPKAFALTGSSEGEFLSIFFCNPQVFAEQSHYLKDLVHRSRSMSENELFINNFINCKVVRRRLRD